LIEGSDGVVFPGMEEEMWLNIFHGCGLTVTGLVAGGGIVLTITDNRVLHSSVDTLE